MVQPPSDQGSDQSPVPPSLHSFQFTFRASPTNSGNSSYIEPDPSSHSSQLNSESLSESVLNFPVEFGRTYHAYRAGSYAFPNDMPEQERLAFQYELITQLFEGKLFFAPFSESAPPKAILDIATGTGDWAMNMGDMFPESEVIGTDLSPIQPADVPPNVNFFVEDSGDQWEYSQNFDFIHTRITAGCWSSYRDQIIRQAFDNLTPGGWFEAQEIDGTFGCDDGTLTEDSYMVNWFRDINIAGEAMDRPIAAGSLLKGWLEEVGFVDVHEKIVKAPTNAWPKNERLKELGQLWFENWAGGLSGFSVMLFNRVFDRSPAEVEVNLTHVRRELGDSRIHAYCPIFVVYGRKPFPHEVS